MKTKIFSNCTVKMIMLFFALSLLNISCRKDDPEPQPIVYPEENFLNGYLSSSGFSQKVTNFVNTGNYEFGVSFTPTVKGKINSLKVKLPDANANLRVTVWDFTTKTVLATEIVNVASANTEVTKTITPLMLEKDKKYFISMNSGDWYDRTKTDNSIAIYPITSGNITINSYQWISSTTAETKFPTSISSYYYAGDLSFNFQRIE